MLESLSWKSEEVTIILFTVRVVWKKFSHASTYSLEPVRHDYSIAAVLENEPAPTSLATRLLGVEKGKKGPGPRLPLPPEVVSFVGMYPNTSSTVAKGLFLKYQG